MSTSTEEVRTSVSPRLLHTIGSLRKSDGGPTRTVTALCRELGRLGAQVELVARDRSDSADSNLLLPPAEWVTTTLVPNHRMPLVGSLVTTRFHAVARDRCTRQRLQLIHDHGIWLPSNHASASLARELDLPLVISPRGMLEPWALGWRATKKRLGLALYQRRDLESAALLVATAEQEAENLRRFGIRQPIAVIPNGVDLVGGEWPTATEAHAPRAVRHALFLSRIHPKKGLENLLMAWAKIQPEGWILQLAGPDEDGHLGDVLALAERLWIRDRVQYLGEFDDRAKWEVFRGADLFVLPSFTENFGVAVAEALSQGLPVITTTGTPWGDLQTFGCGWWVAPNEAGLQDALKEAFFMPPDRLVEMGKRGRDYVQRYDWSVIASQMLGAYRWLLGQESLPDCIRLD